MVTFHPEAITTECGKALELLLTQPALASFYLAGGTALALQIGHRISTDLDWFSPLQLLESWDRERLRSALGQASAFEVINEQDGQMFARLAGVDISFIHQPHPLLESVVDYHGTPLASPTDIGLMKLAAINSRGTRRDFIDLFCLRDWASINQLTELAETKYADRPTFLDIAARALVYFADAERQPMPHLLWREIRWTDVVKYCQEGARSLTNRMREKHR